MKRYVYLTFICFVLGCLSACALNSSSEVKKQKALISEKELLEQKKLKNLPSSAENEINASDFRRAVQTAVRNMVRSGSLNNPAGGRYVVTVSHIVDTTKKNFDTADIKQKLSTDLAASRKVRVVAPGSKNVVPQINISGRITQRTAYIRNGKKRQEYYLHLVLTEAKSGIMLWENVTPVVKRK